MILVAYGTRPEWIKLKILINLLKQTHEVCVLYTGQQKDIGLFEYDKKITLKNGKNRLNDIISSILESDIFENVNHVIVQGDTASAFAVALSAFNAGIPVSHIEAGLRTFDSKNPYPEESYRQMISCLASYHFCPTTKDYKNILNERKNGEIFIVGNTVIDTLPKLPISYENKVLVTLHRRENIPIIKNWFEEIDDIANNYKDIEFILPSHPNPLVKDVTKILKNVKVVEPMPHDELLNFLSKCKLIITDSGGLQEEASFYNKKVIVCRKTTERPAKNQLIVENPNLLKTYFKKVIKNYKVSDPCPFGYGDASQKIYEVLIKKIN